MVDNNIIYLEIISMQQMHHIFHVVPIGTQKEFLLTALFAYEKSERDPQKSLPDTYREENRHMWIYNNVRISLSREVSF